MKILLRNFDNKEYEWKDAEFVDGNFKVDNNVVRQTNIVYVFEDNRSDFVKCSHCGEVFRKGSPEIAVHRNKYKDVNQCFNCQYMRKRNNTTTGVQYERRSDGKYDVTTKSVATLICDHGYYRWFDDADIISEATRDRCQYKACATSTMEEIEDIFTRMPGVFDNIITTDKVNSVGYKELKVYDQSIHFRLKGRNEIWAVANSLNIVDYFLVTYHGNTWKILYSKTYDKLFEIRGWDYHEWNPREMTSVTKQYIKEKIAELYR